MVTGELGVGVVAVVTPIAAPSPNAPVRLILLSEYKYTLFALAPLVFPVILAAPESFKLPYLLTYTPAPLSPDVLSLMIPPFMVK